MVDTSPGAWVEVEMPWDERSVMEQRQELVMLLQVEGANRRELFRRFGVSAETGYKWLGRHLAGEALADRSRCPKAQPRRTAEAIEQAVLGVRERYPLWGARKLKAVLAREQPGLVVPSDATVHMILKRHGRLDPGPCATAGFTRFERAAPNELWQMDFKGWSKLGDGSHLHPLTVVDDHSRYCLTIKALGNEQGPGVKAALEQAFHRHGLPQAFYVDNGKPWGDSQTQTQTQTWSSFGVWLLKLGIELIHSRPYHPQGRGKNERFHRTLKREVLNLRPLARLSDAQRAFDGWRQVYNHERPHEALGQRPPVTRYRMSPRTMPESLPGPQYAPGEVTRKVLANKGYISFANALWRMPEAFCGETVAIRPTTKDGCFNICFASHVIRTIDLNDKQQP